MSLPATTPHRPRKRRATVVLALGLLAALAAAHLPFTRSRVRSRLLPAIAGRLGLEASAADLDYNLLRLDVRLRGLRLAVPGRAPFLEVESLRLGLGWRLLLGQARLTDVDAAGVKLRVERDRDGRVNLPGRGPGAPAASLELPRLRVRDAAITVADAGSGASAAIEQTSFELVRGRDGLVGAFSSARPVSWRWRDHQGRWTLSPVRFVLAARQLTLEPVRLSGDGARLELGGRIEEPLGAARLEIAVSGDADLAQASRVFGVDAPLRGRCSWSGRVTGDTSRPVATLSWNGPALGYGSSPDAALTLTATATPESVRLTDVDLRLGGARVRARAAITADFVDGAWRLGGDARIAADDVGAWTSGRARGTARVSGMLAGTLAAPEASGRLEFDGLAARSLAGPAFSGSAEWSADRTALRLKGLEARAGAARLAGSAEARLDQRRLDGELRLQVPELAAWTLPAAAAGALEARATLAGSLEEPRLRLTAEARDARIAGQAFARIDVHGSLDRRSAELVSARLHQATGELDASGRYDWGSGSLSLAARGRDLRLEPAAVAGGGLALGGGVDLDVEAEGPASALDGRGSLSIADSAWQGCRFGRLKADLRLQAGRLSVDARAPELDVTARGGLGLAAPYAWQLSAEAAPRDLQALAQRLALASPLPVQGSATLRASAEGRGAAMPSSAEVHVDALDLRLAEARVGLERPAWLRFDAGDVAADVALGGSISATLHGRSSGDGSAALQGSVDADVAPLAPLLELIEGPAAGGTPTPDRAWQGRLHSMLAASGRWPQLHLAGELSLDDARAPLPNGWPPLERLALRARLDDASLELETLDAVWMGARASGAARVPRGWLEALVSPSRADAGPAEPASGRLRLEVARPADFALMFGNERVTGGDRPMALEADVTATAPRVDAVRASLSVAGADVVVGDVPLRAAGPVGVQLEASRLRLEDWRWSGPGTDVRVSGGARLGPGAVEDVALDLKADGTLDLRVAAAVSRNAELGGTARFEAAVSGSIGAPQLEGDLRLEGGVVRYRPARLSFDDLVGEAKWSPQRFEIVSLRGLANGGSLSGAGGFDLRDGRPQSGSLSLAARGVTLNWPRGFRGSLDAALSLDAASGGTTLSGKASLASGSYHTRKRVSLQLYDLIAALSGEAAASGLDDVKLDVALGTADALRVDALDAKLAVSGDVRLVGSYGRPGLDGRLRARSGGEIFIGGHTYKLRSASFDFSRGRGFEPFVAVRGTTRASTYNVGLDLTGPALSLTPRFVSDPPLGERDIVSLLTTGRLVGSSGSATAGSLDAASLVTQGLLGEAGGLFGLDSVRLEQSGRSQEFDFDPTAVNARANPASRLTFTRRIGDELEATYSQNLDRSGAYTWIVGWKPWRPVELRIYQNDDQDTGGDIRHEISFGGRRGGRPEREKPPAAAEKRERVAALSVAGDPGVSQAGLERRLQLRPGKRFDYDTWLADRDRLQSALAAAGFLEARVLARRDPPGGSPNAGGDVSLEYSVQRGPRCSLAFEGYPEPGGLGDQILTAWALSEYDTSIEDEAVRLTRRQLLDHAHPLAEVRASSSQTGDPATKRMLVRVEPGPRVGRQRIVFEGNRAVSPAQLQALVVRIGPKAAWLDPAGLRREVEAYYARQGFPWAHAESGSPRLAADEATLAVQVDEGEQPRIATVDVVGARGLAPEAVRAAAALDAGGPYQPAELAKVRARVESAYRSQGWSEAAARVGARLDRQQAVVGVTIEVQEGPRQRLDSVVVEGAEGGARERIEQRLQLTPGDPVVLDDWAKARTRLYETGVYRSVDLTPEPLAGDEASGETLVRAQLKVVEWPWLRLRYGAQYLDTPSDSGRPGGPGVILELSRQTLFGRAIAVGAAASLQQDDQTTRAFVTLPRTFDRPLRTSLYFTWEQLRVADATTGIEITGRSAQTTLEERYRASSRIELSAAYDIARTTFELPAAAIAAEPALAGQLSQRVARVGGSIVIDGRNSLIDATRGYFHSTSGRWGGAAVGSELPLSSLLVQQFGYLPLGRSVVFGSAARFEWNSGTGNLFFPQDILQFGGSTTIRGYPGETLEATDLISQATRSNVLILNEELRFPVFRQVRGVAFFDWGRRFTELAGQSLDERRYSTGLGLRYVTPVGVLRLDFGVPLDSGFDLSRGRFQFGLGQVF